MVKTVLSVSHQGLRDWTIQRFTALYMLVYCILFFIWFLTQELTFKIWHDLFALQAMKVATILFISSLLFHAWIGIWTVLTDYVKILWLRAILNSLILFSLFACFFWGMFILWSV